MIFSYLMKWVLIVLSDVPDQGDLRGRTDSRVALSYFGDAMVLRHIAKRGLLRQKNSIFLIHNLRHGRPLMIVLPSFYSYSGDTI